MEFFCLRPYHPAIAASFSSRFFCASTMSLKLMTLAFPIIVDLINAYVQLSLFYINKSAFF
jgi:hypothetical protein